MNFFSFVWLNRERKDRKLFFCIKKILFALEATRKLISGGFLLPLEKSFSQNHEQKRNDEHPRR